MRKFLLATAVGALSGVAMLAGAASPNETSSEARAYMNYSFGGDSKSMASRFHYGLRLDYANRFSQDVRPPLLRMDFDRAGLTQTQINGLSVVQRLRLNQNEESAPAESAPAEEAAPPAEESAPAESSAPESTQSSESSDSSSSDGSEGGASSGTDYAIIDWGLIAVGAIGIGFVAAETLDTDESEAPPPADDGGGDGGTLLGTLNLGVSPDRTGIYGEADHERQLWLDGGTGQMGDLGG